MYSEIRITDNFSIATFDICLGIGLLLLLVVFFRLAKKTYNYPKNETLTVAEYLVISLACAYFCAVLFDALLKLKSNDGKFVIETMNFYGGLIGGVGAFLLLMHFNKKRTISILKWFDVVIPGVVIAHFWGRIGCFMGGCCHGKLTDSFLGVVYPTGALANYNYYEGAKVYPTPLFEAFGLLVLSIVLLTLFKKNRLAIYLIGYGIIRFITEFYRGDDRGTLGIDFLSPAQIISLCLIIGGSVLLYILQRKGEKPCTDS